MTQQILQNTENLWVDLKTIAELKQITTRALRISLKKDKYVSRELITQGGKSSEILLSSLDSDIQQKYKDIYYKEIIELETQAEIFAPPTEKMSSKFIPEAAKTIALAKLDLLCEWITFRNQYKPKHKGDKLFLERRAGSMGYAEAMLNIYNKKLQRAPLNLTKLYNPNNNRQKECSEQAETIGGLNLKVPFF